jgi:hypothetical protein
MAKVPTRGSLEPLAVSLFGPYPELEKTDMVEEKRDQEEDDPDAKDGGRDGNGDDQIDDELAVVREEEEPGQDANQDRATEGASPAHEVISELDNFLNDSGDDDFGGGSSPIQRSPQPSPVKQRQSEKAAEEEDDHQQERERDDDQMDVDH